MEKITVGITTEFITISNLLKYAGVLETGGQAHEAIEAGDRKSTRQNSSHGVQSRMPSSA